MCALVTWLVVRVVSTAAGAGFRKLAGFCQMMLCPLSFIAVLSCWVNKLQGLVWGLVCSHNVLVPRLNYRTSKLCHANNEARPAQPTTQKLYEFVCLQRVTCQDLTVGHSYKPHQIQFILFMLKL